MMFLVGGIEKKKYIIHSNTKFSNFTKWNYFQPPNGSSHVENCNFEPIGLIYKENYHFLLSFHLNNISSGLLHYNSNILLLIIGNIVAQNQILGVVV